jgi:hypothetical protein
MQMHAMYDDSLRDLAPEQVHWRANDRGLPIAFILWHYVRTEDNVINFVLQRKPTVWITGEWDVKFGLDRVAQGTGMSLADAQALRIDPVADFLAYAQDVWKATDGFLAAADESLLDEKVTVKPLGEMLVANAIGNMCLTHGFTHLGEIQHLRGLMGLRGMAW